MKTHHPQPDWLRNMTYGLEKGGTFRVLVDGVKFAVVQEPGGKYRSGQETKYGATSYMLVDKNGYFGHGSGILNCSRELQGGGRIGSRILARWATLVDACDDAGRFVEQYVVGRVDGGPIGNHVGNPSPTPDKLYFPTRAAATEWLDGHRNGFDPEGVERGDYYIDGPEES